MNTTIFTIPRPFKDITVSHRQGNAVQSWITLEPRPEVILCGDCRGVGRYARSMDCVWLPQIERNEYGTPLVSDAFKQVFKVAKNDILIYVNCDIILFQDIIEALSVVTRAFFDEHFMMVGQRWDVDIDRSLDFFGDWKGDLESLMKQTGKLHAPGGSDYFAGRRGFSNMPPFAVGRCGWDNWAISTAVGGGIPVIDASVDVTVVHQGIPVHKHHQRTEEDMKYVRLYEKTRNAKVIGNLSDAQYELLAGEVHKRR